jgi:hypothetical protein
MHIWFDISTKTSSELEEESLDFILRLLDNPDSSLTAVHQHGEREGALSYWESLINETGVSGNLSRRVIRNTQAVPEPNDDSKLSELASLPLAEVAYNLMIRHPGTHLNTIGMLCEFLEKWMAASVPNTAVIYDRYLINLKAEVCDEIWQTPSNVKESSTNFRFSNIGLLVACAENAGLENLDIRSELCPSEHWMNAKTSKSWESFSNEGLSVVRNWFSERLKVFLDEAFPQRKVIVTIEDASLSSVTHQGRLHHDRMLGLGYSPNSPHFIFPSGFMVHQENLHEDKVRRNFVKRLKKATANDKDALAHNFVVRGFCPKEPDLTTIWRG